MDKEDSRSILSEFVMNEDVTELAVVDDLWYFIYHSPTVGVIVGSS